MTDPIVSGVVLDDYMRMSDLSGKLLATHDVTDLLENLNGYLQSTTPSLSGKLLSNHDVSSLFALADLSAYLQSTTPSLSGKLLSNIYGA